MLLGLVDHAILLVLLTDRNTPSKVVWRTEIVMATAEGCGFSPN
jgi:hypothetical protein